MTTFNTTKDNFSFEAVEDLLRDEFEGDVEQRAGEGWTILDWAAKFVLDGYFDESRDETAQRQIAEEFNAYQAMDWADYCEAACRFEESLPKCDRAFEDEEADKAWTVVDNHFLYGGDWQTDRLGSYE